MTNTTEESGAQRLAAFSRAPAATQREFWDAIKRNAERERKMDRGIEALHGLRPRGQDRLIRWDERWEKRAYNRRFHEERGFKDTGFQLPEAERLKEIPAEDYVRELTGEEPGRDRKIRCPLPEHDERTPSFHVRGTTWKCYGCNRHGTIYDLASALWDLPLRGEGFLDLHKRLMERFG